MPTGQGNTGAVEEGLVLLDAGPSPRGSHRLSEVIACPQRFAWTYGDESVPRAVQAAPSQAALRGSILHVGLAHLYAALRAQQGGPSVVGFYTPRRAMRVYGVGEGASEDMQDACGLTLRQYAAHYTNESQRYEILEIEHLMETTVGTRAHRYTARADLIVRERATGLVRILDHKTSASVDYKASSRYVLSLQMLGLQHLGAERYGVNFGGILINQISMAADGTPARFTRFTPEPAPEALAQFPSTVSDAEERIASLRASGRSLDAWPRAMGDPCVGPYGRCRFFERCQFGDC